VQWTRSETLVLAQQSCSTCFGLGLRAGKNGTSAPCNCVLRSIFRICYARFRACSSKEKYVSRVSLEANPGRERKTVWGLKNEEYTADFCLVARRVLADDRYRLFKFHFLLGAEWGECAKRLNLNRGEFFHAVYRIQAQLGRAFRELEPYALFPIDQYFSSHQVEPPEEPLLIEPDRAPWLGPQKKGRYSKFPLKTGAA
jgi:hypothetical protein